MTPMKLFLTAAALLAAGCSVTAGGQIPCADDSSCPSDYPVCQSGKCVAGTSTSALTVAIIGVDGKSAGAPLKGTVTVKASAHAKAGVKSVTLSAGGTSQNPTGNVAEVYSFSLDTTKLADGSVSLSAIVTAGDDQTATSATFSITVDNTPPTITAPSGSGAPVLSQAFASAGTVVNIDLSVNEPATLVATATDGTHTFPLLEVDSGAAGVRRLSFNATASVPAGSYKVTIIATDTAGNSSSITDSTNTPLRFTVVALPSQPTITPGASPVTVSATDLTASVVQHSGYTYAWKLSSGVITAGQGSNFITFTAPSAVGTILLSCDEVDAAGTHSPTATTQVAVIAAASQPTITTVVNGVNADSVVASSTGNQASVTPHANMTYTWSVNGSLTGFTGQGSAIITYLAPPSGTVALSVTEVNLAAVASAAGTKTMTVVASSLNPISITTPANVTSGTAGNAANVTNQTGVTFNWTISSNGVITAGGGTNSIQFNAGVTGTDVTLNVTAVQTNPATGAVSTTAPAIVHVVAAPVINSFSAARTTVTSNTSTTLSAMITSDGCGTSGNCKVTINSAGGTQLGSDLNNGSNGPIPTANLSAASTIFFLTVKNSAGSSAQATVVVTTVALPSFTSGTFTVTPNPTVFGANSNLTFQSPTYSASVVGPGTIVDSTGASIATIPSNSTITTPSTIVQPNVSTTYFLVVQNAGGSSATASAFLEVRDTFSIGHTPPAAFLGATATLLPNGKVFIAGGASDTSCTTPSNAAFLYDEHNDSYTSVGPMNRARCQHTATLLPDGTVLLIGGTTDTHTEIYKPDSASGTFVADVSLPTTTAVTRRQHTATLVTCSNVVLVAGGIDLSNGNTVQNTTEKLALTTAGSPTGNFSSTNTVTLKDNRSQHTATFFPSGSTLSCKILIAGGSAGGTGKTAEIYTANDSATADTSAATKNGGNGSDMVVAGRTQHTATLLTSGKVLLAGGIALPSTTAIATAELFDPTQLGAGQTSFAATSSLVNPRTLHSATKLSNGKVLIAGGNGSTSGSAELYSATGTSPVVVGNMNAARSLHTTTPIFSGLFLVLGGNSTASAELFDPE
ncbi:MAG: hypothetical protein E6J78_20510 [Deltaproteobacteria bacterium]|nr:MAG: hypothetical protein E6J78_20510 [Deltaproteobacteria bacterium]